MKSIKLFVLKQCPYCNRALKYLEQLQQEPIYQKMDIEIIDEQKYHVLANSYDYYYVPCFYVNEVKVAEGIVNYQEVQAILDQAIK